MSQRDGDLFERASEFLAMFRRGAEFTRELVEENARLRRRLLEVEQRQNDAAQDPKEWDRLREELVERIEGFETERQDALERLQALEEENRSFAERFLQIEEENNNLANLYVASYQLHSTLDLQEVLRIVVEIVINLVGAEVLCVYALDERTNQLEPVAAEGRERSSFRAEPLGTGSIGGAAAQGEIAYRENVASAEGDEPLVCIPLCVGDKPIGAIALFGLLVQKERFTPLDHELFTLLGGHAATAMLAAQLHGQSERKLNTMQGLIELLTK
jgi:nitrate/nitrite-specific signal transduction histidine kinase